jgi:signal transduction histidine kinase
MHARVQRMDKLLTDLLAYSRAGRLRYPADRIHTRTLVDNIVDLLHLPPGFTVTLVEPMPTATLETVPLETVLRNLIGNSIKHHNHP